MTNWLHVEKFPELSVTVHVTIVFPKGKMEGALFDIEAMLQLSEVKGVPRLTPIAVHSELVAVSKVLGQIMIGLVLSTTTTNCSQEVALPALSTTIQVTIVLPIG